MVNSVNVTFILELVGVLALNASVVVARYYGSPQE